MVPATMLTSTTPMPAAPPAASQAASAGDFAALLAPMTAQDEGSTPASQAATPQRDANDSGRSTKGASSRTRANSETKRQDESGKASSQGSNTQTVPGPVVPQATKSGAPPQKANVVAASPKTITPNSAPGDASGLQVKPQGLDGSAANTNFKADGDSTENSPAAAASALEAMNALQAAVATAVKADANASAPSHLNVAPNKQAAGQAGAVQLHQGQTAVKADQSVEGTADQPSGVLPAVGTTVNSAIQEHAAKDAVNTLVKSAVSQAVVQSGKEATLKSVSGHGASSKLPGATQIAGAHAPVKSAGETAGGNERNAGSGQNSPKKNNEFSPAKGTEVTAQVDATQAKPAGHDVTDAAARVAPDPSASSSDVKQAASSADAATLPANPQAAAAAAEAANNEFTQPASLVHSTSLLNELGRSEMKVGMRVGDFGNVEIRTQMHDQQLKAEISVEHRDLGHILTNDLPALQQKLQQSDFSLASLTVRHEGAPAGGFQGDSRSPQQFYSTPQGGGIAAGHIESILSPEEVREGSSGLDIRI